MNETDQQVQVGFALYGRVQGVGFRWWACRTGHQLGLRGTVRNRGDGAVEVHVAGEPSDVARLAKCLGEGPPLARVDRVESIPSTHSLPPTFRMLP